VFPYRYVHSIVNLEEIYLCCISKLLHSDLELYSSRFLTTLENRSPITSDFFGLLTKVKEFTKHCERKVPGIPIIPLNKLFEPFVFFWIKDLQTKLIDWVQEACTLDKWEPLDKDSLRYSGSVVDMFCMCTQPLEILQKVGYLQEGDKKNNKFIAQFSLAIDKILGNYTSTLLELSTNDLAPADQLKLNAFLERMEKKIRDRNPAPTGGESKSFPDQLIERINRRACRISLFNNRKEVEVDSSPKFSTNISSKLCIMANNIETARIMLENLDNVFDGNLSELLLLTFRSLKDSVTKILGTMVFRVNTVILPLLRKLVDSNDEKQRKQINPLKFPDMSELLEFLDDQMEIASDYLLSPLLIRFLKLLWETIMSDFVDVLLPQSGMGLSPDKAYLLEQAIEPLRNLFHADGVGLQTRLLDSGACAFVRSLIDLFHVDTQALIDLYKVFSETQSDLSQREDMLYTSSHILNILAGRLKDKQAQKFLKQALGQKD